MRDLILTTMPPIYPKNSLVRLKEISAEEAGEVVIHADKNGLIINRVTFDNSARLLSQISGVKVERAARSGQQIHLRLGDQVLQVRLKDREPKPAESESLRPEQCEFVLSIILEDNI